MTTSPPFSPSSLKGDVTNSEDEHHGEVRGNGQKVADEDDDVASAEENGKDKEDSAKEAGDQCDSTVSCGATDATALQERGDEAEALPASKKLKTE